MEDKVASPRFQTLLLALTAHAFVAGATNAGTGAPLLSGTYSDVLIVTVDSQ